MTIFLKTREKVHKWTPSYGIEGYNKTQPQPKSSVDASNLTLSRRDKVQQLRQGGAHVLPMQSADYEYWHYCSAGDASGGVRVFDDSSEGHTGVY